jgi:hypothetical protein
MHSRSCSFRDSFALAQTSRKRSTTCEGKSVGCDYAMTSGWTPGAELLTCAAESRNRSSLRWEEGFEAREELDTATGEAL